jgi:predicted GNAT superfamily acetyltransferase
MSRMPSIVYRRAKSEDYSGILRLQEANYIANLSNEERKFGFLSAEFTDAQIHEMATDLGITVAMNGVEIAGYLCAFRNEFNHGSPVLTKMFESYTRVCFDGRPLSSYSSYCYGPVCIGSEYRGQGLLRGLYQTHRRDLAGRFDIGVAFVARNNPYSLTAHVGGLGMSEVGEFQVNDQSYVILAFRLPS